MSGISFRQSAHQVPQKFTSTTLPRSSSVDSSPPDSMAILTCGAGTGRSETYAAHTAIASVAATAIILAFMRLILAGVLAIWTGSALAQLEGVTRADATAALKAALEKGSVAAVANLGRIDGFLGNPQVRIPLPESAQRAEKLMRRVGMGHYADELVVTMNRAAEAAVPEAKALFVQSLKKMTVQDAKGILTGGETAGTEYFRRTTRADMHQRFLPIVRKATARVDLAQKYEQYADKAVAVGMLAKEDADLDEYVTQKALDGLYLMVAEEEKKIRKDPVSAGSAIVRKVFGVLSSSR